MNLEEFLQLKKDESNKQAEILAQLKEEKSGQIIVTDELIKVLTNTDLTTLLKLAITNKKIDALCKLAVFDANWEKQWRHSFTPAKDEAEHKKPTHEYQPIATRTCFDLLKGQHIYNAYQDLIHGKTVTPELIKEAEAYLKLSAEYGCFYALNALCVNGLHLIHESCEHKDEKRRQEAYSLADQVLQYAQQAANLYWTPGYYLMANVYQELTSCADKLFPQAPSEVSKKLLYSEALTALNVAQKLEDNSAAMVTCAYHGKSLKEASRNKFKGWLPAKLQLQEKAGTLLQEIDVRKAQQQADVITQGIKKVYQKIFTPEVNLNSPAPRNFVTNKTF